MASLQAQQLAASLVVEFYDSKMDPDSAMAAMLHLTQRFYSLELTYVLLPQLIEYAKKKSIYHSERLEVRILTHNAMLGFVFKDFEMVTLNYAYDISRAICVQLLSYIYVGC